MTEHVDTELRHEFTDRNLVALTQPLIQPATATGAQRDVERLMALDARSWLPAYWAALLHTLIVSIDPEDPWRRLSGVTLHVAVGDTTPQEGQPQEGRFGAWRPDGHTFGSIGDMLDVVRLDNVDLSRDPALAPFADGLQADSAALLAGAGASAQTVVDMLTGMVRDLSCLGRAQTAAIVCAAVDPAIRWAIGRRLACAPGEGMAFIWAAHGRAQTVADATTGDPMDLDERVPPDADLDWATPVLEAGAVASGTYRALVAAVRATR